MFQYCPQCGLILKKKNAQLCPVCNTEFADVPQKYLSKEGNLFLSQQARNDFINQVIIPGENFNAELAENRDRILAEKEAAHKQIVAQKVQEYNANKPTRVCPVCGSSNLDTISNLGKVAKISILGVWGAGDLGKKWRCNGCGYRF